MTFWQAFRFEYRICRRHRGVLYSLASAYQYASEPAKF